MKNSKKVLIGILGLIALSCSGVFSWTLYQQHLERSTMLSHADSFLKRWHLPPRSQFHSVAIGRREKQLKSFVYIVLIKEDGMRVSLQHRPFYPYIVSADIEDLGLPKLKQELTEKNAKDVLDRYFGADGGEKASLIGEPQSDPYWLTIGFVLSDKRSSYTARFDVETGQLRRIYYTSRR